MMKKSLVITAVIVIVVVAIAGITLVSIRPALNIKIGNFMEYTGGWSGYGPMQDDEIAVMDSVINANPPLGRKIEWVKYDMKSTAEGGLDAAKKMISVEGCTILMFADSVSYPAMRSWLIDTGRLKDIFVNTGYGGGIPDEWGGTETDPLFRTTMPDTAQAWAQAHWIKQMGFTQAVILGATTEEVAVWMEETPKALSAKGVTLLDTVRFEPGRTSYRDVLADVMAKNPQVVLLGAMDEDAGLIWKNAYEMGFNPTWMGINDVHSPRSVEIAGAIDWSKIYCTNPYGAGPGLDELMTQWHKVFPGKDLWPMTTGQWDSGISTALAIEKAGTTEASALARALREVCCPPGIKVTSYDEGIRLIREGKDIDFEGSGSDLNWDAAGDVWGDFVTMRVEAGSWVTFGTLITGYK